MTGSTSLTLDFAGAQLHSASQLLRKYTVTANGDRTSQGTVSFTTTGDFAGVPCSIFESQACTGSVTFTPTALGLRTGILNMSASANESQFERASVTYIVQGIGAPAGPGMTFSPTTVSTSPLGATAAIVPVTIYNVGSTSLTFSAATFTGTNAAEFTTASTTCTTAIAPNSSCILYVTETPTDYGLRSATLSITDTTSGQVFSKPLSFLATYAAPTASTPSPSTFYAHLNTTVTLAETVTRPITDPLTISIAGSAAFAIDNKACAAGAASCSFNIAFTPPTVTTYSATVVLTDTYTGLATTIALSGSGGIPNATFFPQSLTFPSTAVGSTSAPQSISIQNTGDTGLSFNDYLTSSSFANLNSCPTTLAAGASCSVSVSFKPTASGTATGGLVFQNQNNNPPTNLPITIPLTGTAP